MGFYWVLLGLSRFDRVLVGSIVFYWVFTGFYWVLLGSSWFHWVPLGLVGFDLVLLWRAPCNWVRFGRSGFLPSSTGLELGKKKKKRRGRGATKPIWVQERRWTITRPRRCCQFWPVANGRFPRNSKKKNGKIGKKKEHGVGGPGPTTRWSSRSCKPVGILFKYLSVSSGPLSTTQPPNE